MALLVVFLSLLFAECVFCRPTSDAKSTLKDNHNENQNEKLFLGGFQIEENGTPSKFAMLLREELHQQEKEISKHQDESGPSNTRSRQSRSLYFKLCVRYRRGRCIRRKRFGLWHSYKRGGGTPKSS
uniref:Cnidarian restricted protein n=1 Tax=Clytia hemisphaerica TaxID=252671 RepID=A0A7M5WSC7_9CNID|eukprot:TCONS_00000935-protein